RCHRKVVVELLRQRCADVVRSDGMRFDLTSGLYVGMTADGAYSESVDPALFDLYRPVWGERVYDPVMWLGLSFQRTDGIWIQPLQSDEEGWL
ncbi:MAG: hypothetical protein J2P37_35590, partial [Ktedonobacteraceae bacterium]|nr:hypothetical protein [Ktedonobacteraceae bacterium]